MTPDHIRAMIAEGRNLVPDHLWPGLALDRFSQDLAELWVDYLADESAVAA